MMVSRFLLRTLQRFPTDKTYFIAKEVSTTERTYLKDLEVITSVCTAFPLRHEITSFISANTQQERSWI